MSNFYENFILYVCFRDGEPSPSDIGRDVRKQVRNEWGHCRVNDWNDLKYLNCFSLMIKFAKTFPDSMKSKVVLIEELTEWQENGLKLVGKYVEPELLRKVFKEYSSMLKQIKDWKDVNLERFSIVSGRIDRFSEKVIDLEKNIGEVQTDFSDIHSTIKIHEGRLKHLEESDVSNTMDKQLNCPPMHNTNVNVHGVVGGNTIHGDLNLHLHVDGNENRQDTRRLGSLLHRKIQGVGII